MMVCSLRFSVSIPYLHASRIVCYNLSLSHMLCLFLAVIQDGAHAASVETSLTRSQIEALHCESDLKSLLCAWYPCNRFNETEGSLKTLD